MAKPVQTGKVASNQAETRFLVEAGGIRFYNAPSVKTAAPARIGGPGRSPEKLSIKTITYT
jgi:hypothetical protein